MLPRTLWLPGVAARGSRRAVPRRVGALLVQLLFLGCGAADDGRHIAPGGERDSRYRVEIETDAGPVSGVLSLRVVPVEDWHLVPDSPASLGVTGRGVAFPRALLASEDAIYDGDESLAFSLPFDREVDGDARVSGQLKFGICQGDDERCVVIRRDLEFVLQATSADLGDGSS